MCKKNAKYLLFWPKKMHVCAKYAKYAQCASHIPSPVKGPGGELLKFGRPGGPGEFCFFADRYTLVYGPFLDLNPTNGHNSGWMQN